jgi:quercetin dioxygenase-like cupin family protein
VSQVERGLASFSVRTLYNVATVLGLSMDSLFEELPDDSAVDDPARATPQPATTDAARDSGIVLRAEQRPVIPLEGGTRWERLTPRAEVGAEFIEVVYPPGQEEPPPGEFVRHNSREYGVVLRGALTVQVGFDQTVLNAGDSIAFDSHIPHRFWNGSPEEVRAVWFIRENPVSGPDEMLAPLHPGARRSLRHPT